MENSNIDFKNEFRNQNKALELDDPSHLKPQAPRGSFGNCCAKSEQMHSFLGIKRLLWCWQHMEIGRADVGRGFKQISCFDCQTLAKTCWGVVVWHCVVFSLCCDLLVCSS